MLDNPRRELRYCNEQYGYVEAYSVDASDGLDYLRMVLEELKRREEACFAKEETRSEKEIIASFPLLLVVLSHPDFITTQGKEAVEYLRQIKELARYKVMILIDHVPNTRTQANDFGKILQAEKICLLMDDVANSLFMDLP